MKTSAIQIVLSFFNALEKRIWNNQIDTHKYFATICILIVCLIGALTTGGEILRHSLDWDINVSTYASLLVVCMIILYNIYESIINTQTPMIAFLRSLLILGVLILAYAIGCLASVVLAAIIVIVCIILFVIFLYKLIFNVMTDGPRTKATLRSSELTDWTGLGDKTGELSSDGLTFYADDGSEWKREDTNSNNWVRQ